MGSFSGTYDAQDRLLSYGDFVYEYTANGELKKKTNVVTGEVQELTYDAFGNLLSVVFKNAGGVVTKTVEYVLDGVKRRIGKKVNGQLVKQYFYRTVTQVLGQTDQDGTFSRITGSVIIRSGRTYRIVRDNVGSVRFVVDTSNGSIVQEIEYDEFGNVVADSNPGFQPYGFASGIYDPDTGYVRFGAREFDPQSGRWLSKDPSLFEGGDLNLYGYVLNDPINFTDPFGLSTWPTDHSTVTDTFDSPRPGGRTHKGVDIRNPKGSSVLSSDSGTVEKVWSDNEGGNQIKIRNSDGSESGYAHTEPSSGLDEGDYVNEGQVIGHSDDSGVGAPHLHYTWRPCPDCEKEDPLKHLPPPGTCPLR